MTVKDINGRICKRECIILDFSQKYPMVVLTKIIIVITIKCFSKNNHINYSTMVSYDKIGVSEGIDVNKEKCVKRLYYLPLLVSFR